MGSVSVSSCRCCMFVSCVHTMSVLNAAFCMTCSLLMLVERSRGILQSRSHNFLVGSIECLIWLNPFATGLFSVCSAVTVECCV